jgi:hypothetical protein
MSKGILRPVMGGVAAVLAVTTLAWVGCGSSGTGRPGSTGGTTGAAGTAAGTGGTATGTGGTATGTGGAAGATALTCTANPTTALLTNFGSASGDGGVTASGQWGTLGQLTGHTFGYKGAMTNDAGVMSSVTATIDRTAMDLQLQGTVVAGDYAGGGMSFDTCVNSTMWTGIQFTIGGTTDGCNLAFQLQTLSQEGTSNKGTCTSSCYNFPNKTITVPATPTPMTILFSDLAGTGMPADPAAFEMEMFGLQWQFTSAAPVGDGGIQMGCSPNITITNVSWVQ